MEHTINQADKIDALFQVLRSEQTEVTLVFNWIRTRKAAFNLVSRMVTVSGDTDTLSFHIKDVQDELMADFEIQYALDIEMIVISELNRFSFALQVKQVKKHDDEGFLITTGYPKQGTYRQIRRAVRLLNNLPKTLKSNECHLYDISMTGMALLIPEAFSFSPEEELFIELKVPTIFNDKCEYKDLEGCVRVIRFCEYNDALKLMGVEFTQLSEFNKALVYRYILQRKNEFLTHSHVMAAIDVISLQPAANVARP